MSPDVNTKIIRVAEVKGRGQGLVASREVGQCLLGVATEGVCVQLGDPQSPPKWSPAPPPLPYIFISSLFCRTLVRNSIPQN